MAEMTATEFSAIVARNASRDVLAKAKHAERKLSKARSIIDSQAHKIEELSERLARAEEEVGMLRKRVCRCDARTREIMAERDRWWNIYLDAAREFNLPFTVKH